MKNGDGAMKDGGGFDARNKGWYLLAMAVLLVGELAVVIAVLMGKAPQFSISHGRTLVAYSVAAACTLAFILALERSAVRPIYWLCLSLVAFSVAGLVSGYRPFISIVAGATGALLMLLAFLLGDHGDRNSPRRTIRIRLPWR